MTRFANSPVQSRRNSGVPNNVNSETIFLRDDAFVTLYTSSEYEEYFISLSQTLSFNY